MAIEVVIKGFRSIQSATITLNEGVNVLIGPNGSGKSNILSAIRFISDSLEHGVAVAMGKAGGPQRNYRKNSAEIKFRISTYYSKIKIDHEMVDLDLTWDVTIAPRGPDKIPAVIYESILIHPKGQITQKVLMASISRPANQKPSMRQYLISAEKTSARLFKKPHGGFFQGSKAEILQKAKVGIREILKRSKKPARSDVCMIPAFASLHPSIAQLVQALKSVDEFNIEPEKAREASDQLPQTRMKNNGAGLSDVLHALQSGQINRLFGNRFSFREKQGSYIPMPGVSYWNLWSVEDARGLKVSHAALTRGGVMEKIESELSSAVPAIDSIGTAIDATSGRRYVTLKRENMEFRPNEVSDGTIKWLCLLVALHLPYSLLFQLEEPENFMHPWMQQRFVSLMRERSKGAKTIYLCTSHSATILNSLRPEELILVSNELGSTITDKVRDIKAVNKFLQDSRFGLGDLWVSGGIGATP